MELDLDLELDLSEDKIQDFLRNKLNEIKVTNERLKQFKDRQKFSNEDIMDIEDQAKIFLKYKKVVNGKFVICYEVNNFGVYPLENLSLILNRNLDYQVTLFESMEPDVQLSAIPTFLSNHDFLLCNEITDTLKKSNKIVKNGFLIVTLDIPDFLDSIVVKLEGFVVFEQQLNSSEKILSLPSLELNLDDLHKQEENDVLTMISGLFPFNLTMIIPQTWTTPMDSTFEIHCSFQKLAISSRCRKYFLAKKIYEEINDSLIVIHAASSKMPNVYPLTIYSKNTKHLIHTIHHLHRCIEDLLILPSFYDNRYFAMETDEEYTRSQLSSNIQEEVQFILDFLGKSKLDPDLLTSEEIKQFRQELGKLEEKTDLQHLKLTKYITLFK